MGSSQNVELEAAKFLHKLIQESRDEPAKLATKLYVILQHMKSSGKEHSMPYQVISRAMETVINQHGLDIEALRASRLPMTGGTQISDSTNAQYAGSSNVIGAAKDSKMGLSGNEMSKSGPVASSRPPVGPSSTDHDYYQGSATHRSCQSFDQESPSSLDSRSANSQSQEKHDSVNWDKQINDKDGKKGAKKRKKVDTSVVEPPSDSPQQLDPHNSLVTPRNMKMNRVEPPAYLVKRGNNEQARHGLVKVAEKPVDPQMFSNRGDGTSTSGEKILESEVPISSTSIDANKMVQGAWRSNGPEMSMLRNTAPREAGKLPVSQVPISSQLRLPFKEQQLKQLRAQCLVFLAIRNGLMPKKLHLEIALGNNFPKEDALRKEADPRGVAQSFNEARSSTEIMTPPGKLDAARETDSVAPGTTCSGRLYEVESLKEVDNRRVEDKNGPQSDYSVQAEVRKLEGESRMRETAISQTCLSSASQPPDFSGARGGLTVNNPLEDLENSNILVGRNNQATATMGMNKPLNPETMNWTGIGSNSEVSRGSLAPFASQHEVLVDRKNNPSTQFQNIRNNSGLGSHHIDSQSSFSIGERWKPISGTYDEYRTVLPSKDASVTPNLAPHDDLKVPESESRCISEVHKVVSVDEVRNGTLFSMEQEDDYKSAPSDMPTSPKYTMLEKWMIDRQKKKLLNEQNWLLKQQKTEKRIATCFDKLKDTVSSSEDISAKTRSVIELKKLQLLQLQRRLRNEFLNNFFKPISTEMDRLKSCKKYKHGRRIKQLEKFELKMKEERHKRIRERQKEFFGEIEVHKEKLDDVFKVKRERWKGFNKYVKEFHKRKERIHREKIDRIQREKINLLKINDVEGYLRMVQDAKSDRVKQLLKETEKYLQKLGSKLKEAKSVARDFDDMDEAGTVNDAEKSETAIENEDESDQAKHYLESNEKYYKMAHSVKESIAEQPSCLQGGKLREYQMNGLRWLVSLYNNHLNGILADEMGLGKTVQVISLICYLMENKNDRGPFLVVVPSSVLPGWVSELNFWAPSVLKIVYSGPPEERRRLFKERIVHQKFNVLLTTYEYLMNKHDRPKLSKLHWHYIIIDEGHRIKNASCKLNADLKHYQSSHRLLLTGTPLQNNLEELWALLNFLLPNIFNSSEDFSQWFNKPFEGNGDNSAEEALLSEEENLLIINRLHQVLRPFVLRRLKHKVENELPEKIERLVRCEASAYQKLLMRRVEENLGSIGSSKVRSVHNSVMELRNICNHPYLSQLHAEEVDSFIPKHFLPPVIRLCGKLEMLDRILPKLKATDHRVLFFSTMTRLLDVMEEYLYWKQYRYLRLDGHTSGGDRGALIDSFNGPDSPYFIFLLSIRAGGVGVNLQAADTVIIFDTDWNPQVDLQAQARAHRIGQKRDVLVLRFETVQTVEEQVRAAAEHKLGVANQSITAGFFDNNTSAEDRREYLESLLRESKKEEAAPVLDDDALNDLLARSESEIDVFETVDKERREQEMAIWKKLVLGHGISEPAPSLPSRLVTDDDLKEFSEAMKIFEVPKAGEVTHVGIKRKSGYLGSLDTQHYGRGKRAREVRSYEEQWTEEEFDKMCKVESPDSPRLKELVTGEMSTNASVSVAVLKEELPVASPIPPPILPLPQHQTPPSKRGRGRPKRSTVIAPVVLPPPGTVKVEMVLQRDTSSISKLGCPDTLASQGTSDHLVTGVAPNSQLTTPVPYITPGPGSVPACSAPNQVKGQSRKTQTGQEAPRRRGKKQGLVPPPAPGSVCSPDLRQDDLSQGKSTNPLVGQVMVASDIVSNASTTQLPSHLPGSTTSKNFSEANDQPAFGVSPNLESSPAFPVVDSVSKIALVSNPEPTQSRGMNRKTAAVAPRRRGKKPAAAAPAMQNVVTGGSVNSNGNLSTNLIDSSVNKATLVTSTQENIVNPVTSITSATQPRPEPDGITVQGVESTKQLENFTLGKQIVSSSTCDDTMRPQGPTLEQNQNTVAISNVTKEISSGDCMSKANLCELSSNNAGATVDSTVSNNNVIEALKSPSAQDTPETEVQSGCLPSSVAMGVNTKTVIAVTPENAPSSQSTSLFPPVASTLQFAPQCPSEHVQPKRPGRKTVRREEPPRRRGRKPATVPTIFDGSAGKESKDLNVHEQSQEQLGDLSNSKDVCLRGKSGTDILESANLEDHAGATQLAETVQAQGLKRKEQSAKTSQHKPLLASSTKLDASTGFSDKSPVLGRFQTANVNDVARVLKEVFSGTGLSKAKVGESSGKECKDILSMPFLSKSSVDAVRNQKPEEIASLAMPNVVRAVLNSDIPVEGCEKGSLIIADEMKSDSANAFDASPILRNSDDSDASKVIDNVENKMDCFSEGLSKSSPDKSSNEVPSSLKNCGENHPVSTLHTPSDSSNTSTVIAPVSPLKELQTSPLFMARISDTVATVAATSSDNAGEDAEVSANQACCIELSSDIRKNTLGLDGKTIVGSPETSHLDNKILGCPTATTMLEMVGQSRIDDSSVKDNDAKCPLEVPVEVCKVSNTEFDLIHVETSRGSSTRQDCSSASPSITEDSKMNEMVSVSDELRTELDLRPVVSVETSTVVPYQDCSGISSAVIDNATMNELVADSGESRKCSQDNSNCEGLFGHNGSPDHSSVMSFNESSDPGMLSAKPEVEGCPSETVVLNTQKEVNDTDPALGQIGAVSKQDVIILPDVSACGQDQSKTSVPCMLKLTSGNKLELASKELPKGSIFDESIHVHKISTGSPGDSDTAEFGGDNHTPQGNSELLAHKGKTMEDNAEFVNPDAVSEDCIPVPDIQDSEDNKADKNGACLMDMDISKSWHQDVTDVGGTAPAASATPLIKKESISSATVQMDVSNVGVRVLEDIIDNVALPSSSLQEGEENFSCSSVTNQAESLVNLDEPKKFEVDADVQVNASEVDEIISENVVQENSNNTSFALEDEKIESGEINPVSQRETKQSDVQVEDVSLHSLEEDKSGGLVPQSSSPAIEEINMKVLSETSLVNSGDQTDLPVSSCKVTDKEKFEHSLKEDVSNCTVSESIEALQASVLLSEKESEYPVVLAPSKTNKDSCQMDPISSPASLEKPSELQSSSGETSSDSAKPLEDCKDSNYKIPKMEASDNDSRQVQSTTENKDPLAFPMEMEEEKLEAPADDQIAVSQIVEFVPENTVNALILPSPPMAKDEEKENKSGETIMPSSPVLKEVGEAEGLSEGVSVSSSEAMVQTDIEDQTVERTDASKVGETSLEKTEQQMVNPPSSAPAENESLEGSSMLDRVDSADAIVETAMCDQVGVPPVEKTAITQVGETSLEKTEQQMVNLPSSAPAENESLEGSSMQDRVDSADAVVETAMCNQVDVPPVEKTVITRVEETSLEKTEQQIVNPPSSVPTENERLGSSVQDQDDSTDAVVETAMCDPVDVPLVCNDAGNESANLDLPPGSTVEDETVE